jgi:hypothetical protein
MSLRVLTQVELSSGEANAASGTVDHLDAVTGLGPSTWLQHLVTGSRDSHIKASALFDQLGTCFVVSPWGRAYAARRAVAERGRGPLGGWLCA